MVLVRMHAAGRDQAHQVAGAAACLAGARSSPCSAGAVRDLAARDGVADARQVLHHHAAGADVEMPDLGIAHLARRQADIAGRRCAGRRAGRSPTGGRRSGVRAWRTALSAASSRQPQPSRITSITGRRFCMSKMPFPITHLIQIARCIQSGPPCQFTGLMLRRRRSRRLEASPHGLCARPCFETPIFDRLLSMRAALVALAPHKFKIPVLHMVNARAANQSAAQLR